MTLTLMQKIHAVQERRASEQARLEAGCYNAEGRRCQIYACDRAIEAGHKALAAPWDKYLVRRAHRLLNEIIPTR